MKKTNLFTLFIIMFKIGLFTFGGGYAMISIIEREVCEKKKWISQTEFLDMVAIAESTPGPIAINSSTYIGYKQRGVLGSIFATIGVVLPSFLIIFAISLFLDKFLQNKWVGYAFKGIQACIPFLIITAGLKLLKGLKKTPFNLIMFSICVIALALLTIFAKSFSTVFYILIAGGIGVATYLIKSLIEKCNANKNRKEKENDRNS